MWELDYKESWALRNWCIWTVVLEKTLESPLDCKEIQPVHPKGDQSWVFIERMMLKLKFQSFGHLMWRADSFEKTLTENAHKMGILAQMDLEFRFLNSQKCPQTESRKYKTWADQLPGLKCISIFKNFQQSKYQHQMAYQAVKNELTPIFLKLFQNTDEEGLILHPPMDCIPHHNKGIYDKPGFPQWLSS